VPDDSEQNAETRGPPSNAAEEAASAASPTSPNSPTDVVLLAGPTEDGAGIRVLRARHPGAPIEAGELRPLEEGKPLAGEVVTLKPRAGAPRVCDVLVHYAPKSSERASEAKSASSGPRQIASDAYRDQWQKIFGTRARTLS
jgi:hypothetical protein